MYNIEGLRVVKLLRVSTDKQTSGDDKDVPAQRQILDEFIEREKLIVYREFVEGGVSGFKTKMEKRDALQTIKKLADTKSFDALLVYKSDRIGRVSDESPLIIKYLNDKGIRVFTAFDGEIKTNTQMDKLQTFLNFWLNESESVKISERSTDYLMLLIKQGKYKGGYIPYGYKLVDNGTKNDKGRKIYDLEINKEQANIVKLIYRLSIQNNLGARAIAKYLNENGYKSKSKNKKGWAFTSVNTILNNIVYKGYLHMDSKVREEKVISSKLEHLVIISEEDWELNQKSIQRRKTNGKNDNEIQGITQGKSLLAGLVYCGHCKNKMHLWNNHKNYIKKNGEKKKIIVSNYKCKSSITSGRINCEGQSTYSTKKIDGYVEDEVISFIMQLQNKQLNESTKKELIDSHDILIKEREQAEKILEENQKNLSTLKKEIPLVIRGVSKLFSKDNMDVLNDSMNLYKTEIDSLLKELNKIDSKINSSKSMIKDFDKINLNVESWITNYHNSNLSKQKIMISEVVEEVSIYKDYIRIIFSKTLLKFKENCNTCNGSERVPFALPNCNTTLPFKFERIIKMSVA